MRHIASCSFGKDSIAMIIERMERGEPIDEIVYCKIMYNNTISAEFPEHEDFIHNKAIPELERRYGLKTTVVQAERTYLDIFYSKYKSGKNIGKIYGFPFMAGPWCNGRLKTTVISQYEKAKGKHKTIVVIAADEPKRIQRALAKGQILPLVDYKITEAMAFDICKKHDLLSPAYKDGRTRLGCWFCHNQRIGELRKLRDEYPKLWQELMRIERDSPVTFKPDNTIACFEKLFCFEDKQMRMEM